MAVTPKQARNGVPGAPGGTGGNVAQPGPTPDIASVKAEAEGHGKDWQETGHVIFDTGTVPDLGVVDWDTKLAIKEGPGEA